MKNWKMAPSLEKLLAQLNATFPNRSKASDGGVGDLRHSARKSDHNPDDRNVVCARDFTFDTNPNDGIGINCNHLADALVKNRDPRLAYIIWNGRIYSNPKNAGWAWRKYTGPNPHNHHLHLSVRHEPQFADSTAAWNLGDLHDESLLPRTYSVQSGDTVSGICKKFGLKTVEFYQKNNFTTENFDANKIRVGDVFKV